MEIRCKSCKRTVQVDGRHYCPALGRSFRVNAEDSSLFETLGEILTEVFDSLSSNRTSHHIDHSGPVECDIGGCDGGGGD